MLATCAPPLQPVSPIELRPATIVVSSTIVVAQGLWRDGKLLLTVSSGQANRFYTACAPVPLVVLYRRATVFCGACKRHVPPEAARDGRCGFTGWCNRCVGELARRCEERHGRLPAPATEFVCPACFLILPLAALQAPDRDGRRRFICTACRNARIQRVRRQRRRLAAEACAT